MINNSQSFSLKNLIIALVAIVLAVSVFLGMQTNQSSVSLASQAENSTSLDQALTNHKPTLVEFYANWCTSCQAMAPQMASLKGEYENQINFVMLNVDNSKWLPEILKYRVDGIPHFVYLNAKGEALTEAIGEQPLSIMKESLQALIENKPLTKQTLTGQVSDFTPSLNTNNSPDDPLSHGGNKS